jgi:hypothetical protein|tara:strand:- start:633 stop:797 length:165 start_codon:yes stop_codon:yes gene_type:complete
MKNDQTNLVESDLDEIELALARVESSLHQLAEDQNDPGEVVSWAINLSSDFVVE